MPDDRGRIQKGERFSPTTEFKPGQHWRARKPHWDKTWLKTEYLIKKRSAADIAKEENCNENSIFHWLKKYGIARRSLSEARRLALRDISGERNPMYGQIGEANPHWKGGTTPARQGFYASEEWAYGVRFVWRRDKAICQRCKRESKRKGQFHIHHRISFSVKELRVNLDNLVLLCRTCHNWVHSKGNARGLFLGSFQASMLKV